MSDKATVFVVDDDGAVRKGLQSLIESVNLEARTFGSAPEFLDAYEDHHPGCLVLDVRMPGMGGLDLQEELNRRGIQIPVIILTGYGDAPMTVRAMKTGALDFIEKPFHDQTLLDRIRDALDMDARRRQEEAEQSGVVNRFQLLTEREREVMDLVVAGKLNKQIAAELHLSKKTVEFHRAHIMQKLKAENAADLVRMAVTSGAYKPTA